MHNTAGNALSLIAEVIRKNVAAEAQPRLTEAAASAMAGALDLGALVSKFLFWVADDSHWGIRSMLNDRHALSVLDGVASLLRGEGAGDVSWFDKMEGATYALLAAQEREGVVLRRSRTGDLPEDLPARAESWACCGLYKLTCAYSGVFENSGEFASAAVWLTTAARKYFADKNSANPDAVFQVYADKLTELIRSATTSAS